MAEHIVKTYDQELDALNRAISEMGGLAETMLVDAVNALSDLDVGLAGRAIATDERIDMLQRQIEEAAILTIAKRQPMANDLRDCVAAIRIAGDLERVGDLARNIAKRAVALSKDSARLPRPTTGLRTMQATASLQLKDVLDAYTQRDVARAQSVWARDADLDTLDDTMFRDLLTFMMEDPRNITACTHLMFCSKNLERIGDHTTNIAETVYYLVTGQTLPNERPKGTRHFSGEAPKSLEETSQ